MTNSERGQWTSASNAEADLQCAGRHRAQAGLPDVKLNEDEADFGTSVHEALAGKKDPASLTFEQREIYEACENIAYDQVGKHFKGFPTTTLREQRFWATWELIKHSGQVDRLDRRHHQALILDYKALWGEIPESPRNLQLRDLACLAYLNLPLLKEVAVAVIQPRVTRHPEICVYAEADLHRATAEMFARVAASNSEAAPRTPGEVQCKYCLAKSRCQEYIRWVGSMMPAAPANLFDVPVGQWTPEQRTKFCDKVGVMEAWLSQTKAAMKALLEADPTAIPGWHLKPGAKRNNIAKAQDLFDRFTALGGKIEDFMSCVSITKGDLKERVSAITGLRGQQLNRVIHQMLTGLTVEHQNRPSLAKTKDEPEGPNAIEA